MASGDGPGDAAPSVAAPDPGPTTRNPERWTSVWRAAVCALLLLAFALRVFRLDGQSFWHDEGLSVAAASLPVGEMISSSVGQDHPPTYFLVLHYWMGLAGGSDYALRFASVLSATAGLAVLWVLASRLVRPRQATLALALVAISPLDLYYAQETRGYALLGTVALLATYSYLRLFQQPRAGAVTTPMNGHPVGGRDMRSRVWAGVYWSAALLTLTTHLAGALVIAVHTLHWLATPRPRPRLGLRLFVLLWLPWALWTALSYFETDMLSSMVGPGSLGSGLLSTWLAFAGGDAVDRLGASSLGQPARWPPLAAAAALPVWLAAAAGLASLWRRGQPQRLLVGLILLPPLAGIAISLTSRPFVARYVFPSALIFAIAAVAGGAALRGRWRPLGVCCLAWMAGVGAAYAGFYFFDPAQARDDHRSAARFINAEAGKDEAVIAVSPYFGPVLSRYLDPRLPLFGLPAGHGAKPSDTQGRVAELARAYDRLWLAAWQEDAWDPEHIVRGWLETRGFLNRVEGFRGLRVRSYLTRQPVTSEVPATASPADEPLGDAARLVGYEMVEKPTPGRVRVTLYWQPLRSLAGTDYSVFVHVVSASSHAWAQKDNRPAYDRFPSGRWRPGMVIADGYDLELLAGTPPGNYWLEVGMYDTGSGEPLANPRTGQEHVRLGPVGLAGSLPPSPSRVARQRFADLELLEATWSGDPRPGGALDATLLWRAATRPTESYAIALRLWGDGTELLRRNAVPGEGAYPTLAWEPGRLVRLQMRLPLPETTAPGRYALEVGVHVDATAQEVPPSGGSAPFVRLDDVVVRSHQP